MDQPLSATSVPSFVLTDIIYLGGPNISLFEQPAEGDTVFRIHPPDGTWSFKSGLPFAEGSDIVLVNTGVAATTRAMLLGYEADETELASHISYSWQGDVKNFDPVLLATAIPELLLTDVLMNAPGDVFLVEEIPEVSQTDRFLLFSSPAFRPPVHLTSGLSFSEGSNILFKRDGGQSGTFSITLMGQLAQGGEAAPAVGLWGVMIMMLLLVGAGTVVFKRMGVA